MEAGDCLYIPYHWYHHVYSSGRNLAVNVWWWRNPKFDETTTDDSGNCDSSPVTAADCTWGYEPSEDSGVGQVEVPPGKNKPHTKCSPTKEQQTEL